MNRNIRFNHHIIIKVAGFLILFLSFNLAVKGQVKNISGILNTTYTGIDSIYSKVNTDPDTLIVKSISGFAVGDTVLAYQSAGASVARTPGPNNGTVGNLRNTGRYGIFIIKGINPVRKMIVLNTSLLNYTTLINGEVGQLVKVRTFKRVNVSGTLTCDPYDPIAGTGGILVMLVEQSLTLNANIDVSGKGFPGADPGTNEYGGSCTILNNSAYKDSFYLKTSVDSAALKGGGLYETTFSELRGRNFATNAGGGGNGLYSGGGGGGHGNVGGKGGVECGVCSPPGSVGGKGATDMNTYYTGPKIFMGGGGGTGTQKPSLNRLATKGGAGGGIIIIVSDTIIGNGKKITSQGESVTTLATAGAGGGGAGGAIILHAFKYNATASTLTLDVKGGDGGSVSTVPGESCGPGGGGSGGIIWYNGLSISGPVSYVILGGSAGKYNLLLNGAGNGGNSILKNNLNIQIRGFFFNKLPDDQTICQDEIPASINAPPAVGGNGTYTYLWEQSDNKLSWAGALGTNTNAGYVPGVLTDTIYYRRIVNDSDGIIPKDTSIILTINVHPRLNNNAISPDTTVCSGLTANSIYAPVAITGALGSGTYAYTWEQSANNSTWTSATGVNTNAVYPTPVLTDTIYYHRKVTSGACKSTSNSVKITVLEALTGNNISSNQIICYKQTFTPLTVGTISGGEPGDRNYQWQQYYSGPWNDTVTTVNFTPLVLVDSVKYRKIVRSGLNNTCISTSNEVTITVLPKVTNNLLINASDSVFCAGIVLDSLRLRGTAPNGGDKPNFTYTWQKRLPSQSIWTNAQTVYTLQTFNAGVLYDTTYFRRLIFSGANDVCKDTSSAILMKVLPEIGNNIISAPQTICEGEVPAGLTGGIITGGQPADRTYKWQKKSTVIWSDLGVTTPNYNPPALIDTISYRRIVFSGPALGTCKDTTTALVILVQNDITNNKINNLSPVFTCYNKAPALLSATTKTSGGLKGGDETNYTYTWLESINNSVWSLAFQTRTNADYQAEALTFPKYYRRYVQSGVCKDTSLSVKIDTTHLPVLFSLTALATPICFYQTDPYSQINLTIQEGYSPYLINYSDGIGGTGSANLSSRIGFIRPNIVNPSNDSLQYIYIIDKITDKNGCEATAANLLAFNAPIKVFTTPHPTFSAKLIEVCDSVLKISPAPSFGVPQWQYISSLSKNMYVPVNLTNTSIDIKANFFANGDFNSYATLVYQEYKANCHSNDTIHAICYKNPESIGNLYRVSLNDNVPFGDTLIVFISDNQDLKADAVTLGIPIWTITSGPALLDSDTTITNRISGLDLNTPSSFEYSINNGVCPPNTRKVAVIRKDFFVYDGFSPNDDGVNDVLYAQGLYDEEIQFKFQLYSSSGSFIREISRKDVSDFDFIRNEVVLWDGTTKLGGANNKIPDGTYYYVLTVKYKGQNFDKKGFIIVKR